MVIYREIQVGVLGRRNSRPAKYVYDGMVDLFQLKRDPLRKRPETPAAHAKGISLKQPA
jgi:hypothetical protein